jgi:adenine-specific DNA-methyltransferase
MLFYKEEQLSLALPDYNKDQLISIIGSKRPILDHLKMVFANLQTKGKRLTFIDPFSGSSAVSRLARSMNMLVKASDIESFAYIINYVYLTLNENSLDSLFHSYGGIDAFYAYLNYHGLFAAKTREGINRPYISLHYAPQDDENIKLGKERLYFTTQNARFFDAVREEIESLWLQNKISGVEKVIALSSLLYQVSLRANTSGTFTSYHKNFNNLRGRIKEVSQLIVPTLASDNLLPAKVYQQDALSFVSSHSCDICYLDPPSSVVQYGNSYHLLNSVAKWDYYEPSRKLDENGLLVDKGGIRKDWKQSSSSFCSLKDADKAFIQLFGAIDARYIVLTYPTNGIVTADRIVELLKSRHKPIQIIPVYKKNQGGIQSKKQNIEQIFITGQKEVKYFLFEEALERLPLLKRIDSISSAIFKNPKECSLFQFSASVLMDLPLDDEKIYLVALEQLENRVKELEGLVCDDSLEATTLLIEALNKQNLLSEAKARLEKKIIAVLRNESDGNKKRELLNLLKDSNIREWVKKSVESFAKEIL